MSDIIEINYNEIYDNSDIIRTHMEKDGFIKIVFNNPSYFVRVMDSAKEFFYLSHFDKETMIKNNKQKNFNHNMYYGYFPSKLNGKEGLDIPNPTAELSDQSYILCENIIYPQIFTKAAIINEYYTFCHVIGMEILGILIGNDKANSICKDDHLSVLRLNYYPKHTENDDCVENSGGVKLACDTHVDDSLLTLLYQNNTSGLQIQDTKTGNWENVPPSSNSILINSGKLLHMVSNGKYNPINHRVLQNYEERISIPYFMCASANTFINSQYPTYHEYMKNFEQKKEYTHINTLLNEYII